MVPPERWGQVKALFAAAIDRPTGERAAFLADACKDDAPLRQEVEALLAADARATTFIEVPASTIHSSGGDSMILRRGDRLGPYEIVDFIGAGGMGEVYKAWDRRLHRHVALKVLLTSGVHDSAPLDRFDREARAASALNHPNIVTIYDIGRDQSDGLSVAYIAMEVVEGRTLRSLLGEGALPVGQLLDIAGQIADALAAAHRNGIVHRDLTPENVMVGRDGRVKILDFGLARFEMTPASTAPAALVDPASGLTQAGVLIGTLAYMSPQQAKGEAVDFRGDQFSFGAMLYEMATGTHPFHRDTTEEMRAAIIGLDPQPLDRLAPELPAPLHWIVTRCLAKNVEDRYASTVDLADELAIVRGHLAPHPGAADSARAHNLPAPRTALIGRDREVSAIRQLLLGRDVRLATLIGPGGCGKTRLAIQVASDVVDRFFGGVYYVVLATATDPQQVASAILHVLRIPATAGRPVTSLSDCARRAPHLPTLLVLDNFEQVMSAAPLVAQLLDCWPTLTILATSRAPLGVYGEHEIRVPPLGLPAMDVVASAQGLAEYPAVALFLERARAANGGRDFTDADIRAAAEICARVDGLPLAIELSAARTKVFSPVTLLPQLKTRLQLLDNGPRDAPERHRTLRRTMDWSHELLNGAERTLFRRLAVFAGGCPLDAAEAVCNVRGDIGADIVDVLTALADQSLISVSDRQRGDVRFHMLETVQEYALERLAESGEDAAVRQAHSAYCLVLAEEAEIDLAAGREQSTWIERLSLEHGNLRAALGWLASRGNADWGLRLCVALSLYWRSQAPTEGRALLQSFARMPAASRVAELRARALAFAGGIAVDQGDCEPARDLNEEALAAYRQLGNTTGVLASLNNLAVLHRTQGNPAAAASLFLEMIQLLRDADDELSVAHAMTNLADVVRAQGESARAVALHRECLATFRAHGDAAAVAWSLSHQADMAREEGDAETARELYAHALEVFQEHGTQPGVARCLVDLGALARDEGDPAVAQSLYTRALAILHQLGESAEMPRVLEELASCAIARQRWDGALRLAAAASALRGRLGSRVPARLVAELERNVALARERAGSAAAAKAWMEGMALSVDAVVEYARADRA